MITETALTQSKFTQAFVLPHAVAIYVPATADIDNAIDNTEIVNDVLTKLSNLNGGASAIQLTGAWVSDSKGLVLENTVKVISNCERLTAELLDSVYAIAEDIKITMAQDSVAVEIDSALYLI